MLAWQNAVSWAVSGRGMKPLVFITHLNASSSKGVETTTDKNLEFL